MKTARSQGLILVSAAFAGTMASFSATAGGLGSYELGTEDVGLAAAGYAARAQDATTVYTNPAGMTRLDGDQMLLGTQMLFSNLQFSNSNSSPALGGNEGGRSVNVVGLEGVVPGGGLFYSHSVSSDLKLGIAAVANWGLGEKQDDNWMGRYYFQKVVLLGASIVPSLAYRVNDKFSVGASAVAMDGLLKFRSAVNNAVPGMPDGKLEMRDTKWGWGGNVGVLYEPAPGTRLGLTYNSEIKLKFEPQANFSGTGPVLTNLLNARGLNGTKVDLGINVPQQVMGSFFHTMNDRWALLGNVGWQQQSKLGKIAVGLDDTTNPTSLTANLNFKDTWHGALGAQYSPGGNWRYNFGVAYDSDFYRNSTVLAILPGGATWRFGAGAQQEVRKDFSWGIAATFAYGGTLDVNQQGLPVAAGGRGNLVGSYNNISSLYLAANFNWKF